MPKCVYKNINSLKTPFAVAISYNGKSMYIGSYASLKEAELAVKEARKQYPITKKRKVKTWTAAEIQELRNLPYPQKNYMHIAERMGRTVASVYMQHWKMNNVKR